MVPIAFDRHEARALVRGLQVLLDNVSDHPEAHPPLRAIDCAHLRAIQQRCFLELLEDRRQEVAADCGVRIHREAEADRFWRELDERAAAREASKRSAA